MFSLWGKIRLDGAEAKRDAAKAGQSMGNVVGQQFSGALKRFIGAGAILGFVNNQLSQARDISRGSTRAQLSPEAYQEMFTAAEMLGTSIDKLQEVAPQMGKDFVDLMAFIRSRGGIIPDKAVEDLEKVNNAMISGKGPGATATAGALDFLARLGRFQYGLYSNESLDSRLYQLTTPGLPATSEGMDLQRQAVATLKKIEANQVKL